MPFLSPDDGAIVPWPSLILQWIQMDLRCALGSRLLNAILIDEIHISVLYRLFSDPPHHLVASLFFSPSGVPFTSSCCWLFLAQQQVLPPKVPARWLTPTSLPWCLLDPGTLTHPYSTKCGNSKQMWLHLWNDIPFWFFFLFTQTVKSSTQVRKKTTNTVY